MNRRAFLRKTAIVAVVGTAITVEGHKGQAMELNAKPGTYMFVFPSARTEHDVKQIKAFFVSKGFDNCIVIGGTPTKGMAIYKVD